MKRKVIVCISSDLATESSSDAESDAEDEDEDEDEEGEEEEEEEEDSAGTSGSDPSYLEGSPSAVKRGNGKRLEGTSGADSVHERRMIKYKGRSKKKGNARTKTIICDEDFDHYNEVLGIINSNENLDKLTVEQCKSYLRVYSLRLTGSKATLIQRIQEHLELKDGNAMNKYPASTFTINCTGDVCTGDVVLFKQRVHMRPSGSTSRSSGRRVVAGRIVKESYGTHKQQHTFTIEVLWSSGDRKLPLMHSLIIKGRNLYRHRTFRQPWPNELYRARILEEKHARGKLARDARVERLSRKKRDWNCKENARKLASGRNNIEGYQLSSGCNTEECLLEIAACSAGVLIGKHGRNVMAITNTSGARIRVCQHESSSARRVVRLVGTPDQIRSAAKLVRQTIVDKGFPSPVKMKDCSC